MQVAYKVCHLPFPSVQCHLVNPAPLHDVYGGSLYGRLGGKLVSVAAEQGGVICQHCDFGVVWYNHLLIVDVKKQ